MSKLLISCDIQPQYLGGVNFPLEKFVAYMREFDKVLYFFNNKYSPVNVPDTENTVKEMLRDAGADEALFKKIKFFEKQYWYFRDLIDSGLVSDEELVKLFKMMIVMNVDNAKELTIDQLKKCITNPRVCNKLSSGLMKFYFDPKLIYELLDWNDATVVGGLRKQCLSEIFLYLKGLDIKYKENNQYIYG